MSGGSRESRAYLAWACHADPTVRWRPTGDGPASRLARFGCASLRAVRDRPLALALSAVPTFRAPAARAAGGGGRLVRPLASGAAVCSPTPGAPGAADP